MRLLPALSVVLLASAAFAQPPSVSVPQLSAPDRAGAAQIDGDAGSLSARSRAGAVNAPAQVGEGRRSAEAAPPLSSAAQGRAVGVSAVAGYDRCDPAASTSRSEACRRRVETRSGEFSRPVAEPVSAEARLMLLTQAQAPPMSADSAARRLSGNTAQLDDAAGQAAGQLAAAISQTPPSADVVPNGGRPTNSPLSTVLNPATGAIGPFGAVLTPGVPSIVVTTPR